MLAIGDMSNTVQFIFYAIGIVAFALATLGAVMPAGSKMSNLVALGLFAVFFPVFWHTLAAL
jgi:hypothetical protein